MQRPPDTECTGLDGVAVRKRREWDLVSSAVQDEGFPACPPLPLMGKEGEREGSLRKGLRPGCCHHWIFSAYQRLPMPTAAPEAPWLKRRTGVQQTPVPRPGRIRKHRGGRPPRLGWESSAGSTEGQGASALVGEAVSSLGGGQGAGHSLPLPRPAGAGPGEDPGARAEARIRPQPLPRSHGAGSLPALPLLQPESRLRAEGRRIG